jgi:hypothetical protein
VDWVGRYELLRQQRLDGGAAAGGWGRAVLVHRGVAAWMRACSAMPAGPSEVRRTAAISSSFAEEPTRQPLSILPEVSGRVAGVLAQMILETRQEAVT